MGKDTYHHTFFEMLGNWSFDDYFKAEAIQWAWELLTKVWSIEPDRLWATVFQGDAEDSSPPDSDAKSLWPKVTGIPDERVLFGGKKDNFWEMGNIGPCGPCSEIHIDLGPDMCNKKDVPGHRCVINGGCGRFIELWNLVFIQYNRDESGELVPLSANYVDTGAGLERIVAVLQKKKSNYDTDLFMPIIGAVEEITGYEYSSELNNRIDNAFRVISDHIRSLTFAITDGATPSNEGRGYVIRRLLRRASRFGRELGMHEPFMYKLVPTVADAMGDAFGEIKERADYVSTVIESEEANFGRTLDRGIEIFDAAAERAQKSKDKVINGEDAFQLYDTYGFPLDLTELMAEERGLKVDTAKFDELMEEQRRRARAAQKSSSIMNLLGSAYLETTDDSKKYETDICETVVTNIIDPSRKTNIVIGGIGDNKIGKDIGLILRETCFYAESGGQIGDCGMIKSSTAEFVVETTEKFGESIIHWGKLTTGGISTGDKVTAKVDKKRLATKKNHTATHLLQWALRQVMGEAVAQQGSLVGPDYLRFDFTYPKALSNKQLKEVEQLVREKIAEDLPVTCCIMPKSKAEKLGAMALFGEKYGDKVRVVAIGAANKGELEKAFSREFCGGTHCQNTGQIGGFKISKEESISAGVRRITALTGEKLTEFLEQRSGIIDELTEMLKVPAEEVADRVGRLIKDLKTEKRKTRHERRETRDEIMTEAKKLLEKAEKIGRTSVIIGRLSTTSIEQARVAIDMLKKKAKSAAVVLAFADNGKVTLLAGMTDDLVKKGLSAGEVVKAIAPIVDGGGGGRAQMAEAGGKKPEKIDDALTKAAELIKEKLANA
ncbi:Alanine--tRNA ligase [subsurface metagenome]